MKAKILALKEQIESGNIKTLQGKILNYAKEKKFFFIREVERDLKITRTTAVARISELEDMGFIKNQLALKTKYAKAKQGEYAYISDPIMQYEHRHQRKLDRMYRWLKNGHEFEGMLSREDVEYLWKN